MYAWNTRTLWGMGRRTTGACWMPSNKLSEGFCLKGTRSSVMKQSTWHSPLAPAYVYWHTHTHTHTSAHTYPYTQVPIYIYLHIYTCTHTCSHACTCTCVLPYAHTSTHMNILSEEYLHIHIHAYTCTRLITHKYTPAHMHLHISPHMHTPAHVYLHTRTHIHCTCVPAHLCTHKHVQTPSNTISFWNLTCLHKYNLFV